MIDIIKKKLGAIGDLSLLELPGSPDGGTIGVAVFNQFDKRPIAFVKIYRDKDDIRFDNERTVLNLLSINKHILCAETPSYLFHYQSNFSVLLGQTTVPGEPLFIERKGRMYCEKDFDKKLSIITDFLIKLAQVGSVSTQVQTNSLIIEHGDFSLQNILIDNNQVGVIDWSDVVLDGRPLFDYFNFVLNAIFKLRNTSDATELIQLFNFAFFEKNDISMIIKRYADSYLNALNIDKLNIKRLFEQFLSVYCQREIHKKNKAQCTGFFPSYIYKLNGAQQSFSGIFDVLVKSMGDKKLVCIFDE
jgi:hypothetical protein